MKKRKILSLFMALLLVMGSIPFTSLTVSAASGGSGTSDDPYQIKTASDLFDIRNDLNAYYEICNDIDLSTYTDWIPLGDAVHPFTGRLNGNGYTISGVQIGSAATPSTAYSNTGLFGYVSQYGVIHDVGAAVAIYNADGSNCGGLVGKSEGYIVNCHVSGTVVSTAVNCNTGGLVGENAGNFVNCYGTADVTGGSSGTGYLGATGGLVGLSTGVYGVTNCYYAGKVSGLSFDKSGALVGYTYCGLVSNCYWDNVLDAPGTNVGTGTGAKVANSVSSVPTTVAKGTATTNIIYNMNSGGNYAKDTDNLMGIMNKGRAAICLEQLPSGVKASAWGADTQAVNNGYPVFTSASTSGDFTSGSGFITDPYIITTATQITALTNHVIRIDANGDNINYSGATSGLIYAVCEYYTLGDNIDMSGYTYWYQGLEYSNCHLAGVFDGNGYKLYNFSGANPLFYEINTAGVIKNLGVECNGGLKYATVANRNSGIINNCYVIGEINDGVVGGAFVLYNMGLIANCYSSLDMTGHIEGGFLGTSHEKSALVANCCTTGNITSTYDQLGGFIHTPYPRVSTVMNCYSAGDLTVTGFNPGGFSHFGSDAPFVNCYFNSSAIQKNGGTQVSPNIGISTSATGISDKLSPIGITSDVMKGNSASIDYFYTYNENNGTVTANSFIEALNGGRSAVGYNFNFPGANLTSTGTFKVPLSPWAYVPGVNNDYPIPLQPETLVITTQPAGKTISSGDTVTFETGAAVAKDGGTISYQWQKSYDGTTWSNVTDGTGSAAASYTTGNLSNGNSGEKYRCLLTNTLYGVTTDVATDVATITVKPSILPISQTVEAGNAITFCVDSAGPYQWQVSTDTGSTWTDITGANLPYYTTAVLGVSDSGKQYRCILGSINTGLTWQVITDAATVIVTPSTGTTPTVTDVTLNPPTVSVQKGSAYTFAASVIGTNSPSQAVTWSVTGQTSAGTGMIDGVLTVAADEAATTLVVKAVSTEDTSISATATVSVANVPATVSSVTIMPKTVSTVTGSAITFSATIVGTNNPSQDVNWSVSGNSSLSTTISNTGELSIAVDETALAFTVTAVSDIDNTKFDTAAVTITSTPEPAATVSNVAITPDSVSIIKGNIFTFSAAVTGTNNPSQAVSWSVAGNNNASTIINSSGVLAVAAGETAATLTVTATSVVDGTKFGTTAVTVTDASSTDPTVDAVTINPVAAMVAKGNTKSFSAVVTGSNNPVQTVTWSVLGNTSADTGISISGLLTVGADETAATLTVKATSTADSTKFGTAGVVVADTTLPAATVSNVTITPDLATVSKGSTYIFGAAVAGTNNPSQTVNWSVTGNNNAGTIINSSGVLAVAAGETATTLTVTAVSAVDSTKTDTAEVTVAEASSTDPTVDAVAINPTTASVAKGGTKAFNAVVTGSNSPAQTVLWSISGNVSAATQISSSGLLTVGADETALTLTVSAVSTVDGTQSAMATVTVTSTSLPTATVSYVVVSAASNSVQTGKTKTFTAAVAGTNNPSQEVTWSVSGNNSANTVISNTGALTVGADETAASLTVMATSTQDNTKSGTATIVMVYPAPDPSSGGDSSSGGGSGSGSSGSSSSVQTPTVQLEKKPDQPVISEFSITAKADKAGLATAEVSEAFIASAVKKAQDTAKEQGKTENGIGVTVNIVLPDTAKSVGIILTQPTLKTLIDAEVKQLELNGTTVALSFDLEALKEIQKQSNSNEVVIISFTPATGLSGNAKTLIGTRPVYNISITYVKNKKTISITSLGSGSVTLSIPYTLGKKEAAGYLFGVYVDGKGNATRLEGSAYDTNSKSIIFGSNHFSVYGVGYTAPSATFKDISSHWAKEAIDYVVGRGLFSGTSTTAFSPDTAMSRGMLVTALGRLAGVDASEYKTVTFTDVAADQYYASYIEWAYQKGIVSGTGSSQFAPDRAITREEIAQILSNYAKATGYILPVTRGATAYADDSNIGSTYKDAVKALQQAGIMMGGDGNIFKPKANVTRAEVSAMLHRYIKLTIYPATAQGWAVNDAGQHMYYKDGKVLTGWQNIGSGVSKKRYYFNTDAVMVFGK